MSFNIEYHKIVVKEDISALPKREKARIKKAIENKLFERPEVFGKPLQYSLKGYRRLRVGDYRVVFRVENDNVIIFCIAHRSSIYKHVTHRAAE